MKKVLILILATIVILFPILLLEILSCIGIATFLDKDFWLSYMGFFGTASVAAVSLWQNHVLSNQNQKLEKKFEQERYIKENLITEHPLLGIKSVSSYSQLGYKRLDFFDKNPWGNDYCGAKIDGGIAIEFENVGNGKLLNLKHPFLNSLYGVHEKNSQFIECGKSGYLYIPQRYIVKKTQHEIVLRYSNISGFEYEQLLSLSVNVDPRELTDANNNSVSYEYSVELSQIQKPLPNFDKETDDNGKTEI